MLTCLPDTPVSHPPLRDCSMQVTHMTCRPLPVSTSWPLQLARTCVLGRRVSLEECCLCLKFVAGLNYVARGQVFVILAIIKRQVFFWNGVQPVTHPGSPTENGAHHRNALTTNGHPSTPHVGTPGVSPADGPPWQEPPDGSLYAHEFKVGFRLAS